MELFIVSEVAKQLGFTKPTITDRAKKRKIKPTLKTVDFRRHDGVMIKMKVQAFTKEQIELLK